MAHLETSSGNNGDGETDNATKNANGRRGTLELGRSRGSTPGRGGGAGPGSGRGGDWGGDDDVGGRGGGRLGGAGSDGGPSAGLGSRSGGRDLRCRLGSGSRGRGGGSTGGGAGRSGGRGDDGNREADAVLLADALNLRDDGCKEMLVGLSWEKAESRRTLLVGGGAGVLDAGSDLVGQAGHLAVALEIGEGGAAIAAQDAYEAVQRAARQVRDALRVGDRGHGEGNGGEGRLHFDLGMELVPRERLVG